MAELRYRGSWLLCRNYEKDDAVIYGRKRYKALAQNAGMQPDIHPEYWMELSAAEDSLMPIYKHNDLAGIDAEAAGATYHVTQAQAAALNRAENLSGGGALGLLTEQDLNTALAAIPHANLKDVKGNGQFHVSEDEAAALAKANSPSANNPVATMDDVPSIFDLGPWEEVPMPDGVNVIYGAAYHEAKHIICAVSDNKIITIDCKNKMATQTDDLDGDWRAIAAGDAGVVAVGRNVIAVGSDALSLTPVPGATGNWKAVAVWPDGRYIAVADGMAAIGEADGSAPRKISVPAGYGEDIAFDEDWKAYSVGRNGCLETLDGISWMRREYFPEGTWRGVDCRDGVIAACSGKLAHCDPDGAFRVDRTDVGGWDDVAVGSGFILAVTNGRAEVVRQRPYSVEPVAIPNFVFTTAVYGGTYFFALGSAILYCGVTGRFVSREEFEMWRCQCEAGGGGGGGMGADVNYFGSVTVDNVVVRATKPDDTLKFVAGDNVTLTPSAARKEITFTSEGGSGGAGDVLASDQEWQAGTSTSKAPTVKQVKDALKALDDKIDGLDVGGLRQEFNTFKNTVNQFIENHNDGTEYDDTDIKRRLTAIEEMIKNGTVYEAGQYIEINDGTSSDRKKIDVVIPYATTDAVGLVKLAKVPDTD